MEATMGDECWLLEKEVCFGIPVIAHCQVRNQDLSRSMARFAYVKCDHRSGSWANLSLANSLNPN